MNIFQRQYYNCFFIKQSETMCTTNVVETCSQLMVWFEVLNKSIMTVTSS